MKNSPTDEDSISLPMPHFLAIPGIFLILTRINQSKEKSMEQLQITNLFMSACMCFEPKKSMQQQRHHEAEEQDSREDDSMFGTRKSKDSSTSSEEHIPSTLDLFILPWVTSSAPSSYKNSSGEHTRNSAGTTRIFRATTGTHKSFGCCTVERCCAWSEDSINYEEDMDEIKNLEGVFSNQETAKSHHLFWEESILEIQKAKTIRV